MVFFDDREDDFFMRVVSLDDVRTIVAIERQYDNPGVHRDAHLLRSPLPSSCSLLLPLVALRIILPKAEYLSPASLVVPRTRNAAKAHPTETHLLSSIPNPEPFPSLAQIPRGSWSTLPKSACTTSHPGQPTDPAVICETRSRTVSIEVNPNVMKPSMTRRVNREVVSREEVVHSIQESRE